MSRKESIVDVLHANEFLISCGQVEKESSSVEASSGLFLSLVFQAHVMASIARC
jgi:hypothetical protein